MFLRIFTKNYKKRGRGEGGGVQGANLLKRKSHSPFLKFGSSLPGGVVLPSFFLFWALETHFLGLLPSSLHFPQHDIVGPSLPILIELAAK